MPLLRNALLALVALVGAGAVLVAVWPTPTALYVRHVETGQGDDAYTMLGQFVPDDVMSRTDLAYGPGDDQRLDVHRPARGAATLPTIIWLHGGGWVGGDKADVAPYLKILADRGHTVVGVNYSRAPGATYPRPTRDADRAVAFVLEHAEALGVDPDRVVLGGDSAGAQLAAQLATAVTSPTYAKELGLEPALPADDLVGTVLHSGALDPEAMMTGHLGTMTVRSYLGSDIEAAGAQARVVDHVTEDFPATFLTGGNADALEPQGRELEQRLDELGVRTSSLFFPADHRPALGHEYQLNLASAEGRQALEETLAFLADVTGS